MFQHRHVATSGGGPLQGEVAALVEARVSRQRPPVAGVRRVLVRFGSGPAPVPVIDDAGSPESASPAAPPSASYGVLPAWATKKNAASALERLAKDAVSAKGLDLDGVPSLGIVRAPEESEEGFEARVRTAVEAEAQKRAAKVRGPLSRKLEALERRIEAETRELERDRAESTRSKTYSAIDVGASILTSVLGGRKSSMGSAGRAGARAYGRIQRSAENVKESEKKIAEWTAERDALAAEVETSVGGRARPPRGRSGAPGGRSASPSTGRMSGRWNGMCCGRKRVDRKEIAEGKLRPSATFAGARPERGIG